MHRFDEIADRFEQLSMYFMTFHGQENVKKVIEVSYITAGLFHLHLVYRVSSHHVFLIFLLEYFFFQTIHTSRQAVLVMQYSNPIFMLIGSYGVWRAEKKSWNIFGKNLVRVTLQETNTF